jgi:hypothetical protein
MLFQVHGRPGLAGWVAILASMVLLAAVVVGLVILALGFLIFVLPVLLITSAVYYLLMRSKLRQARYRPSANATIIEGEYSVVDPEQKSLSDRSLWDDQSR